MKRNQSLVELMIVVSIVAVLASIAVVSSLESRIAANEAHAIGSMRAVLSAQERFKTAYGLGDFGDLPSLLQRNMLPWDADEAAAPVQNTTSKAPKDLPPGLAKAKKNSKGIEQAIANQSKRAAQTVTTNTSSGNSNEAVIRQGYRFTVTPREGAEAYDYVVIAQPVSHNASGCRSFVMTSKGVIYAADIGDQELDPKLVVKTLPSSFKAIASK